MRGIALIFAVMFAIGFLYFASSSVEAQEQFAGSSKYPVLNISGGNVRLIVKGEQQPTQYTQLYTAEAAAMNIAAMCNCPVTMKIPDRVVSVTWKDNLQYQPPTVKSCDIELKWSAPTQREDGSPLRPEEIAGYFITREFSAIKLPSITKSPNQLNHTELNFDPKSAFRFWIQAFDTNGVHSQRVEIK